MKMITITSPEFMDDLKIEKSKQGAFILMLMTFSAALTKVIFGEINE